VYAICNCNVVQQVHWTLEKTDQGEKFRFMRILPASNKDLEWINAQLAKDKFRPVP